jgi:hypothetical protein
MDDGRELARSFSTPGPTIRLTVRSLPGDFRCSLDLRTGRFDERHRLGRSPCHCSFE